MRVLYGLLCVASLTSVVHPESFVLPKKKQSARTIKEDCNDLLFEALKISPQISMRNAQVQQLGLDLMPAMLEGVFFSAMSKAELDACCKELHAFFARQEKINVLLEEQGTALHKLKGKWVARE